MSDRAHLRVVDTASGELTDHEVVDDRILALTDALAGRDRQIASLKQMLREAQATAAPPDVRDDVQFIWDAYYATALAMNARRRGMKLGPQARQAIEKTLAAGMWDRAYLARSVVGILVEPYRIEGKVYDKIQHALLKKGTVDESKIEHFHDVALRAEGLAANGQAESALMDAALAKTCDCGHPRVDHMRPELVARWLANGHKVRLDPSLGLEPCAHLACECVDFDATADERQLRLEAS